MTIPELLVKQILESYDTSVSEGRFIEDPHKRQMQDKIFEQISSGLTGQFRTLVLNTIAEYQLWDQINEYEFYKIMQSVQLDKNDLADVSRNCETWKKAVERLTQKNIDSNKVCSYFNERNTEGPIDAQTPIGMKKEQGLMND